MGALGVVSDFAAEEIMITNDVLLLFLGSFINLGCLWRFYAKVKYLFRNIHNVQITKQSSLNQFSSNLL